MRAVLSLAVGLGSIAAGRPLAGAEADAEAPAITHRAVEQAVEGQALIIRARIEDPSGVFAPSVYIRVEGMDASYVAIAMRAVDGEPGVFEAVVPAARLQGDLSYFVEAFDELGNGPARVGAPEAPLEVAVVPEAALPKPRRPPGGWTSGGTDVRAATPTPEDDDDGGVLGSWWFWTLVGAAVVGGAAAGVVALSDGGPRDEITLDIRGPDPAAGL